MTSDPRALWAFVDVPPRLGSVNGFSARILRFLGALASRWPVDVFAVSREGETEGEFLGADPPRCHYLWQAAGVNPLARPGIVGASRRASHYLFGVSPYLSHPRRLQAIRRHLDVHPPEIAVFFLPSLAHLALAMPQSVPCVVVLEERLERSLDMATRHLPRFVRGFIRTTESARVNRLYKRVGERSERVVVISDLEKAALAEVIPEHKLFTIPHGVDVEYFAPRQELPTDIDVGVFGDFSQPRNTEAVLALLDELSDAALPSFPTVAVVGNAPPRELQRLSSHNVTVTGKVPDLRPFYARSKVVVVPTRAGTGVKTTVLEAWAMGRPVLATPFALRGIPVEPGQNAAVAEIEEMPAVLASLLADSAERERLATAGLRTVRETRDLKELSRRFLTVCSASVAPSREDNNARMS